MFDPNHLLDFLRRRLNLKSDAALARWISIIARVISNIGHDRLMIGATRMIAMREEPSMSIYELCKV